jgi:hypothetical protein
VSLQWNAYGDANFDRISVPHAYGHRYNVTKSYANGHSYDYGYSDSHSYTNGHGYGYGYFEAYAITADSPNAGASSEPVEVR